MAKTKGPKKRKGKAAAKGVVASGRPRNPFAIVVRRRAAGPEPSPRAYRRRPKHRVSPVREPEE